MTLLTPLGLLGLLAIAVLILIYIVRPNFQQKRVSSTHVWKLSLKYKKKRVPISKFRNILIFICQVLILVSCAVILAQPNLILKEQTSQTEVIAVLDSSASMRTASLEETRYERAVNGILNDFDSMLSNNFVMSVIIADNRPSFLLERVRLQSKEPLAQAMQGLLDGATSCSYGSADIDAAMSLCESILRDNPTAQVYLYTDTSYSYVPGNVKLVNVSQQTEWNAAILNANAELEDNYYVFNVDVACYGRDAEITLNLEIQNVNPSASDSTSGKTVNFQTSVTCTQDVTKRIVFKYFSSGSEIPTPDDKENIVYYIIEDQDKIFSYESVHISLEESDSFAEDNSFDIYGGQKETLKVQYASSLSNSFFNGILDVLKNVYRNRWSFEVTEVKNGEYALKGYDFYIFENDMPEQMPSDGVVFLVNPTTTPQGSGIQIGGVIDLGGESLYLTSEDAHPIMNNVRADRITVSRYSKITGYDQTKFKVLMNCDTSPVLMVTDQEQKIEDGKFVPGVKLAVMAFSLHFSNLALLIDFPLLVYNMFEYFLPPTVSENSYEVFENISLNSRGIELNVVFDGINQQTFTSFPAVLSTGIPGTYTLEQTTFAGKKVSEQIYVKIPAAESNIHAIGDSFTDPYGVEDTNDYLQDLLIYLAAVLVAILFAEWLLHLRDEV